MQTINSNINVQNADLGSEHKFPWKWYLTDLEKVNKNGKKVFSCFSCGGGSTMGYKLAGYEVIGNVEIDKKMMSIYKLNHNPKYSYLMDIREFAKLENLPDELYNLDILDGSPPCSSFSVAGKREKDWSKEKVFREGQQKQTLDDLFFYFIDVAEKLKPKIIIAENVLGLIKGNAKGYVNEIIKRLKEINYNVQLFCLNSAYMGVPQKRKRVFFCCCRNDLNLSKLKLQFNEKPILFGEVRSEKGRELKDGSLYKELIKYRIKSDSCISDIYKRVHGKKSGFNNMILGDNKIAPTLPSGGVFFRMYDGMLLSNEDSINIQTFPQDYNFMGQSVQYVCGMSVPPVMMAQLSTEIYNQWLKN